MKCAHDFAKGDSAVATGVPSGSFGGTTSPVSRDCGRSVCLNVVLSSWMLRGRGAWSRVIEMVVAVVDAVGAAERTASAVLGRIRDSCEEEVTWMLKQENARGS